MNNKLKILSNNQLKLIAMVAMLCDHIGKLLFPEIVILQIIGRLAFPIFSYMIAEGCFYTRNKKKYFLQIFALAAGCQIVYLIAEGSMYQNILVTFSLSVLTIFAIDYFRKNKNILSAVVMLTDIAAVCVLCLVFPGIVDGFHIDYGIFGVLLAVGVYFAPTRTAKLIVCFAFLVALSVDMGGLQWYSLGGILLLMIYSEKKGKLRIKYLFYVFYPLHLAVIYCIKELFFNN